MQASPLIENLTAFNLTRQEAAIYVALLTHGSMTGYEAAKETGIARSNVYSALQSLVEKGALFLLEGETTRYVPEEASVFLGNTISALEEKARSIRENLPRKVVPADGYLTITGARNIANKIRQMLSQTKERVYVLSTKEILSEFEQELRTLAARSKKVVILSDGLEIPGATCHSTQAERGQIRLITDSSRVLTGVLSGDEHDTCLYSGQRNLVDVMKEALKNKIELLSR